MVATSRRIEVRAAPGPVPAPVALARLVALECRAAGRLEAGRACAALAPDAPAEAAMGLLVRALASGMVRRPVLYAPGSRDLSPDERWLLALIAACARGDRGSIRFLTTRRCHPQAHAAIAALAYAVATNAGHLESF